MPVFIGTDMNVRSDTRKIPNSLLIGKPPLPKGQRSSRDIYGLWMTLLFRASVGIRAKKKKGELRETSPFVLSSNPALGTTMVF
jgi:hypothetical protein